MAPADYHRYSPIDSTVGEVRDFPGEYYAVNPQAVNEQSFDVFTTNKCAVLSMTHAASGHSVAFVAIAAMLICPPLSGQACEGCAEHLRRTRK
ncbi:hypothetical protein POSPLADRAFT_1046810 [Postia placenta MAD-698-R-SB12]|uniref:Uncharacterized protein n=1 Tax=Postia placenta MAD-698-R-SB12 TaxID=670580 RepID=A0A1X6MYH5_9APHY|nr:hypothetical protein POSPLADRAFT_1046810 [Postia placenta MAD-698-R-SB12]OSX61409.1 hypothetical protein POSPLADRAFT_1046810 [Postia placenta MAD-698-R-SB12]